MSQSWFTTLNYILIMFLTQSETLNSVSWTSKLNIFYKFSDDNILMWYKYKFCMRMTTSSKWPLREFKRMWRNQLWCMRSTSRYRSCHFQIRTVTVSASDCTQYTHKYIQMHTQTGTQTNIDIKVPPGPTLTQRNHRHTDPVTIPQSHNCA